MKKTLCRIFATLLVTAIIAGAMPIIMPAIKAQAPPPPAFFVSPDQSFNVSTTSVGTVFNETLYVSTTGDTFTYQYEVDFNSTQLACVFAAYTAKTASEFFAGHTTVPTGPTIDNTTGTISGGETLLGSDVVHATPNAVTIITMTFQILVGPPTGGNLTSLISLDPANTFLLDPDLNTVAGVTLGSATYTFSTGPPPPTRHDVAVTSLTLSNNRPKQNDTISIGVVAMNNGTVTETFDVDVTYDGTLIGKQTVTDLPAGNTANLSFDWNTTGLAFGQYTITATSGPVAGETDLSNNAKTAAVSVVSAVFVTDVNGDGKVDMKDIGIVAKALGTTPSDLRWDPRADVNGDGVVNLSDVALVARDFYKH